MSNLNLIIISLLVVAGSLFVVSAINAQQTRKRLISQKLQQLRRKTSEMEEVSAALETLTGNTRISRVIVEDIIDTLHGMQQLAPDNQSLELSLESALQRLEEIDSPSYSCNLNRLLESDSAIAHAQYLLGEAGRVVRKRQAQNLIELPQMTAYIEELAWTHLMVSVISLTGQGHKAVRRGDVMRAHAYYKKAQEAAMQSNVADDRRHRWVKELTDIMTGKQRAISMELMPESQYNPTESVAPPSIS